MANLILLRHGESLWNMENRFTGWTDVDLSPAGILEAELAGKTLKREKFNFDLVFTSFLKRAIKTSWIVLEQMDLMWIPVYRSWRLNERHYGALQGLNKKQTADEHGEEQVQIWRRSYDVTPPPLVKNDPRSAENDPRYKELKPEQIPYTESLRDTVARSIPYWEKNILPELLTGKNVLVSAHGNSLRALIKHLDRISDADIPSVEIPTGIPLIYKLDHTGKPLEHFYCEISR